MEKVVSGINIPDPPHCATLSKSQRHSQDSSISLDLDSGFNVFL
jgi:hypothetical protein